MSQIIKHELQTRSPIETPISQLIKTQSLTLKTRAKPMALGVAEPMENMKTTSLNQFPASMTGVSLPQLTGGTSNVTGHQDTNSESSTVKNTNVSVNSDIGNFNLMDKQPPKVTEDLLLFFTVIMARTNVGRGGIGGRGGGCGLSDHAAARG
nr:PB1 domain, zinc finger, ZZ-type, UBA-like, next to BRCA1, central domain protein [Tanacetum cinerariifolium]